MQAETEAPATASDGTAAPGPGNRAGIGARVRAGLGRWEALLLGLIAVTFVAGQGLSPEFLTADSFTTGSLDLSEVALMALALTLVIVAAEIDLSVASVLALSSALMADLWNRGLPLELIMPICLVVGALCGAFNGVLVTRLGLPSLAVTIGTLALFRGFAYVVIGDESVTDFPITWTDRAFGNFGGTFIPNTMVLFAILAVGFAVVLHATPFGRSIFAIGANEEASYFSGLRVKRIKLILFTVSGTVAALAGIVISLRNSTAAANVGELRAHGDHRGAARRGVDLRRSRHDRRRHPRPGPARWHPEGAAAERVHLVVLDPDRDRSAAGRLGPGSEHHAARRGDATPSLKQ